MCDLYTTSVSALSLVVGRSQVERNADLETVAQQLLGELKKSLTHLEWIEPVTPTEVAGVDARRVEFRWRQQGQPVHQLQLIFLHHDEHLQPLLMQITCISNLIGGMVVTGFHRRVWGMHLTIFFQSSR